MSRSYKKNPCATWKSKWARNQANRCWRHTYSLEDAQYSKYKRYYPQWDVIDYVYLDTWESYWESRIKSYESFEMRYPNTKVNKYPNKKDEYRWWYQHYKGK